MVVYRCFAATSDTSRHMGLLIIFTGIGVTNSSFVEPETLSPHPKMINIAKNNLSAIVSVLSNTLYMLFSWI